MSQAIVAGDGLLRVGDSAWRCCLGRGGLAQHKREGDGATPMGVLPLRRVLYRADRVAPPETCAPLEPIARRDGWCDDEDDPRYNQPVTLPYPARHEVMWRDDALYDIVGVLGWNDDPVQRGAGSAIFLHIARPDYSPTEGCVALLERDLRAALATGFTALRVGQAAAPG